MSFDFVASAHDACRWYSGSEAVHELRGATSVAFASVAWDCVGAPFVTGAHLEADEEGLHVVVLRGVGLRVVRVLLPPMREEARLWLGDGPTVWLSSGSLLWCARLAEDGERWLQAGSTLEEGDEKMCVVGVGERGRLLVSAQSSLGLPEAPSVDFPLAKYSMASQLSVDDVLLVAKHASDSDKWAFRLVALQEDESLSIEQWPVVNCQPFYASVATVVTRIVPGLVAIGTCMGLVLGVAGENNVVFCVKCGDNEAITQIDVAEQRLLVTAGQWLTLASLDGQIIRRTELAKGCKGVLTAAEVVICRGLDVVQRSLLFPEGGATQTSGKVLYALKQRQIEGVEEMAQSEGRLRDKQSLCNSVTAAFSGPSPLAVESISQSFGEDGSWNVLFRLRTSELIAVGRAMLYGAPDGVLTSSAVSSMTRELPGTIFERRVAVQVLPTSISCLSVAIETERGPVVLGQLLCSNLEQQRAEFRSSAFQPMHASAACEARLRINASGTSRLLSCLNPLLQKWSAGLRSFQIDAGATDTLAIVRVSVFGADALVAAVRSLAASLPPDVSVTEMGSGEKSDAARQAMTREIELALSNEASRARLMLAAQIATDEAVCQLMERECETCAKKVVS